MKKCKKCGKLIFRANNYCPKCGDPLEDSIKKLEDEEYAYTCIHCGAKYKAFTCLCSHCGQEQIGIVRSKAIKEFTEKLQELDALKAKKGFGALINRSKIKNIDEQKVELIKTYIIPNSKEDVLEFMVLASSNIDVSLLMANNESELGLKKNDFIKQKAYVNAWYTKREQVYSKAKISFGNDEDFIVIQRIYDEKEDQIKLIRDHREKERRHNNFVLHAIVVIALIAVIVGVIGETLYGDKSQTVSTPSSPATSNSDINVTENEPDKTESEANYTKEKDSKKPEYIQDNETDDSSDEDLSLSIEQEDEPTLTEWDIKNEFNTSCVNHKISDVYDHIVELGYSMTYTAETSNMDFTESVKTDKEIRETFYIIAIKKVDLDNNSVELEITSELIYELNEKLDIMDAWFAMQRYGEKEYSDFDLHYYTGVISQGPCDENTWLLSARCDADGKKGLRCTAKVTGTSDNPRVIEFDVSAN